jgi:hypothetical protein
MHIGLLWYDGDPHLGLEDKIGRAAERYHEKYGCWPDTCMVHPQAMDSQQEGQLQANCLLQGPKGKIRVVSASNILRHHFWLGMSNSDTLSQKPEIAGRAVRRR